MHTNTTTAPQRSSLKGESLPGALRLNGRTPRTSPIDRIAMRVALALLLWSSRPHLDHATAEQHRRREAIREREERERAWLRQRHYTHHL